MKTKNKILIASLSLCLLTATAIGTSTYAWFISNKKASVTVSDITAISSDGALQVELVSSAGFVDSATEAEKTSGIHKIGYSSGNEVLHKLTDISSDGKSFNKVGWSSTADIASGISTRTSPHEEGKTYSNYMTFQLKLTNIGKTSLSVFLGSSTSIAPMTTGDTDQAKKDKNAADCARFAIIDTNGDATRKQIYANSKADETFNYLMTDTSEGASVYGVNGFSKQSQSALSGWHTSYVTKTTIAEAELTGSKVCSLADSSVTDGSNSSTFTINAWIEGEDVDCVASTDSIIGADQGNFKFTIGFYGLTA